MFCVFFNFAQRFVLVSAIKSESYLVSPIHVIIFQFRSDWFSTPTAINKYQDRLREIYSTNKKQNYKKKNTEYESNPE